MLAPNTTSSTLAPRNLAAVARALAISASVARDVANAPPLFAFDSRRYDAMASMTASGTCVPPGPSKNAIGCWSAEKPARSPSTELTTRATSTPARS